MRCIGEHWHVVNQIRMNPGQNTYAGSCHHALASPTGDRWRLPAEKPRDSRERQMTLWVLLIERAFVSRRPGSDFVEAGTPEHKWLRQIRDWCASFPPTTSEPVIESWSYAFTLPSIVAVRTAIYLNREAFIPVSADDPSRLASPMLPIESEWLAREGGMISFLSRKREMPASAPF